MDDLWQAPDVGVEIGVFVREDRIPRRELWQAALEALDLPVEVTTDVDAVRGVQSFRFDGDDVHVQVDLVRRGDEEDWKELRSLLGRRRSRTLGDVDAFVVYRFSSSTDEMACASAACAGLVAAAGGVLWDLAGDEVLTGRAAIALTRQVVGEAQRSNAEEHPLRSTEARALWAHSLIPMIEAETGERVRVEGWTLTIGEVGWLARVISFAVTGSPARRVQPWATVAPLHVGHPHVPWPMHLTVGAGQLPSVASVLVPPDPGPEQEMALDVIARRIRDQALPHLARYPDLEAVALAFDATLADDSMPRTHTLEAVAATSVLLGRDDEARRRYAELVEVIDAEDRTHRRPGDWVDQMRDRAVAMVGLLPADRDAAVRRLAATAAANARDASIPPPVLP